MIVKVIVMIEIDHSCFVRRVLGLSYGPLSSQNQLVLSLSQNFVWIKLINKYKIWYTLSSGQSLTVPKSSILNDLYLGSAGPQHTALRTEVSFHVVVTDTVPSPLPLRSHLNLATSRSSVTVTYLVHSPTKYCFFWDCSKCVDTPGVQKNNSI